MKIGYIAHWFQPPYAFVTFLREELGLEVDSLDFRHPGYLDGYDVLIIEQHGFDDYIENDELYIRDWVAKGGICLFMAQDYRRWVKYFLPEELSQPFLVNRYMTTIGSDGCAIHKSYLCPCVEPAGEALFRYPEEIRPEELAYWKIQVNSFGLVKAENGHPEQVRTAALACAVNCGDWEILASFMDCAIQDGALVLQHRYGKGLYFLSQILFPEVLDPEAARPLAFWRKYARNLLAHLERFRTGAPAPALPERPRHLPPKRNYRAAIHVHSLDWFGADTSVACLQAHMNYLKYDIVTLAVKDALPYHGNFDLDRYNDDRTLFLHGQEFHPFNWTVRDGKNEHHSSYHTLAMGVDADSFTTRFTKGIFDFESVDQEMSAAIEHIHRYHGAACATHPQNDAWTRFPYDAVDHEHLYPLAGTMYERFYAAGGRITLMNSVDMWGVQSVLENPAVNFVYIDGVPDRDGYVAAVKAGHCIAACRFLEADITLGDALPGDELPAASAAALPLRVIARADGENIRGVKVYAADRLVLERAMDTPRLDETFSLEGLELHTCLRVEVYGENPETMAINTPFYLRD